ncbi:type II toxin-antitoxin system VapC family toxin [Candidatus Uhrbacteria bacterium]|nr:type II toxin-antitoxin system VapC family toxin [Candidatus Uhrbacteria bacterium]
MIVLDTNVVISYINDDAAIVSWINRQRAMGESFSVSTITVVELLGFPKITPQEILMIELWLKQVLVVDVDFSVAREAARVRREMKLTTSDSVIAATAVLLRSPVVTRDIAFKKIRDIKVLVP